MQKSFFITSTGTNIGKTVVTCSLIKQLQQLKKEVTAIKPVISGWDAKDIMNDTLQILSCLNQPHTQENILKTSPWRFNAPLAPSMAARQENKEIDYIKLVDFCRDSSSHEYLLCEGAGGVAVPLTQNKTTLNLMCDLNFPVILVVGSYLGSISHTLTAVKTLELFGITINSIIVNESDNSLFLEDVISELKNFIQYPLYQLHRVTEGRFAWERAESILDCLT